MNFRTSPGWVCSVLGLTALLTGCNLGPTGKWYTLSYGWPTVDSGTPISKVTAATLHPGAATRAEVVAELGPPLLLFADPRIIGYTWGTHTGAYRQRGPEIQTGVRIHAFALVFDGNQVLQRHAYFSEPDSQALRRRILEWAQAKQH